MALKRLIVLLPVLVMVITACSKQASNPVAIVAEVTNDGQGGSFIALTPTLDPDAITVIIGTALPFDEEEEILPTATAEILDEETIIEPTAEFIPFETEELSIETIISTSSTPFSTPLPDVILFTATPLPSQTPQGSVDAVSMETSTPFIQATQPIITPSSPLSGDSAVHTPTPSHEEETDTTDATIGGDDEEITTIVTTPSTGAGTRPTLNPDQTRQPEATATEVPEECIHTVVRGDTTFKIALANNTTVAAIQAINPALSNPEVISLGQRIILPNCDVSESTPSAPTADASGDDAGIGTGTGNETGTETVHAVRSGDTLGGIARRYGVSVTALVNRNNITNPDRLSIGQEIIIPSN